MPGLTAGLNIGLSGLTSAQAALDIIGHNIANVNTTGYSRQTAVVSSNGSVNEGNLFFGMGSSLANVQAVRDQLLNLQITNSTSRQAGAQTRNQALETAASIFTDDGTSGISYQLNQFFTALQKLSAQPEDTSVRTNLVGAAKSLIETMQVKYQALQAAQQNADAQVPTLVNQVNTLTKQIAALNQKLAGETNSLNDNDAMDQRQALADQLAQLVGVQTYIDSKNQMTVTLDGGAAPLVAGLTSFDLHAVKGATSPYYTQVTTSAIQTGTPPSDKNVTSGILNGQLGAQLDLRDNLLSGYEQQLDELAAGLAYNVNTLHSTGYSLDGTQHGLDFFVGTAGTTNHLPSNVQVPPSANPADDYRGTVLSLSVNAAIAADPDLIAAGGAAAAGDNSIAKQLVDLQTKTSVIDATGAGPGAATTGPFSTFMSGLVNRIGTDANQWDTTATNQENITTALTNQRSSIAGVDLDTEAANLIMYQRGYQASARFLTVISQLTDQMINQLGR
ncbi:flagellar hook-associated protein FlgK [Mesoterricola sediminis]|uniref:Flagellar hook-associated protein 1 n=1 Tax=Mesoterricola sediminis TaxID=2927980 RepID=A0AA48KDL4_9BACT|nr:flagellar hook-associated protein FlgK [Mesoterricola sediminis]BDU77195.1 flagellar hook-associated protein 1 [Mesoterricola sediminis]